MKVFIERENKHIELTSKNGIELLKSLQINPAEVLLIKNDEVVLPEEELEDSDSIQILSVVSGG